MRKLLLIHILALATFSSAEARIGDTLQECQTRYGAPTKTAKPHVYFKKGAFVIVVTFFEDKVDFIGYWKVEQNILGKSVVCSENEIEQLQKANGGERVWKKREVISTDREWQTEDGELSSFYKTFDNNLVIVTKGCWERAAAAKKAKENKSLEGF
jgi:hypothetical protein